MALDVLFVVVSGDAEHEHNITGGYIRRSNLLGKVFPLQIIRDVVVVSGGG